MQRALALAERGWGRVHPNPLVGAVVVRGREVLGEGWHREFGAAHAEVEALRAAGDGARGATLYVTLEPCAHHGKTPPCTEAILAAGIARVVYGAADPTTPAAGGGLLLRRAGVEVVGPMAEEPTRIQNAPFFHAAERGSPWVALKYALSLDGRLSAEPGRPTPITGPPATSEVQRLRSGFDALLVGSGTAIADDPLLTVRGEVTPRRPPVRLVADTDAALDPASRLLSSVDQAPLWVAAAEDAPGARRRRLENAGARVLRLPRQEGGVDLKALLSALWEEGIRSLLCEGGGRLGSALLAADAVERLYLFYAPLVLGPDGAAAFIGAIPTIGPDLWSSRPPHLLGDDVLLTFDRSR